MEKSAFLPVVFIFAGLILLVYYLSYKIKKEQEEEENQKAQQRKARLQEQLVLLKSKLDGARLQLSNATNKLKRLIELFDRDLDPNTIKIEQVTFRGKHLEALFQVGQTNGFSSRQEISNTITGIKNEYTNMNTWRYTLNSYQSELNEFQRQYPDIK